MKTTLAAMTIMTVAALSGCTQGTPGGPGATGKAPAYGQADNTFNLSVPALSSPLKQGTDAEATIGIKRATNFKEDVTLKFSDVPKGVTIEPGNLMIKHGDTDAKVTFKAGDEAPAGAFPVKVTGHPTKGGDAVVEFTLTIAPKDSFTLSMPSASPSLKQGATQTIVIGIAREKSFDQDVALRFGEMPTGVTMEPVAPVIKAGDKETQVTLTAAADASLGNFTTKVTGHPAQGADVLAELAFTVIKE